MQPGQNSTLLKQSGTHKTWTKKVQALAFFYKQQMHGGVSYYDEGSREYPQAKNVRPVCKNVETKGAENRSARDFNVKAVLVVDQSKIPDFVHDESFKPIMKYRQLGELARRKLGATRIYSLSEATAHRKG